MGQQQLFYLVMAVIIVGFAVMAGFEAANKKYRQSAADHLVEHNLTIATAAVAWKMKNDPFAGGAARYTGLEYNGMQTLFMGEISGKGYYKITRATENELEITAVSLTYPELGVRTFIEGYQILRTDVSFEGSIQIEDSIGG